MSEVSKPKVRNRPEVSVVVPFYNESENVRELHRRLAATLDRAVTSYELVFVNDGSRDDTPAILDDLQGAGSHVVAVHLSRNFGHQAAICAGLQIAAGECVVLMDGDQQDPPEVLPEFIAVWRRGFDVVYAIRTKRKEGLVKRIGYFLFYRLLKAISDIEIPVDSGDFCLMDRKVVTALNALPEKTRFIRGLRTYVGFRQVGLEYERHARAAGRPKYTMAALIRLAIDGLISFSSYPLQLATYCGIAALTFTIPLIGWTLFDAFYQKTAPRGWASTLAVLLTMSAVQLINLGIMGEYIRRIFLETKQRPGYIVSRISRSEVNTPSDQVTQSKPWPETIGSRVVARGA